MLLSFNKILLLIIILLAVWYGFKLVNRLDRARKAKVQAASDDRSSRQTGPETIDLVRSEDGTGFEPRRPGRRR